MQFRIRELEAAAISLGPADGLSGLSFSFPGRPRATPETYALRRRSIPFERVQTTACRHCSGLSKSEGFARREFFPCGADKKGIDGSQRIS